MGIDKTEQFYLINHTVNFTVAIL